MWAGILLHFEHGTMVIVGFDGTTHSVDLSGYNPIQEINANLKKSSKKHSILTYKNVSLPIISKTKFGIDKLRKSCR